MTAARVLIPLNLFAVEAQQIGADVVHFVDIVAVFLEAVDQARADLFPFRRLEVGFQHRDQLGEAQAFLLKHHPFERVQRVAEVGDADTLHPREVIARAAFGNILAVLHAVFNKGREQGNRRPVAVADIANIAAFDHQLNVIANLVADLINQPIPGDIRIAFVFQHHDFHHLQQVKHGDIVQAVGAPRDRQLNAADHRIIPRVFQRDAAVEKRRDHHFIIKDLRNAGAEANGFGGFAQERTVDQLVDPHAEVRLRQAHVLVGVEG